MSQERKNAIITGAASGLGRAMALRLAKDGWRIAIADINQSAADEALRLVKQAGGDGRVEILDITEPAAWTALRDRLQKDWKHLDLLVNNAGVAGGGNVGEYSLDDWKWIMDRNLWGGIYGCHVFVNWLKSNPAGAHIINTASLAAIGSAPGMAAYNVTKAGMFALSETLYAELLSAKVGVTVLCPAFVSTNLLDGSRVTEDQRKFTAKMFQESTLTAEAVADAAIKAMKAKQLYVVLPRSGRIMWYIKRVSPMLYMRRLVKMIAARGGMSGQPTP